MIENICILGGGTSGFFTAAILAKYAKNSNRNLKIKCIHSSKIGVIGVGESTQVNINEGLQFLGFKDEDWMPKCNATYKANVAFESWSEIGEKFFYPFGHTTTNNNEFFELSSLFPNQVTKDQFARYSLFHTRLAENNRLTEEGWNFNEYTAYHFDTHLLSKLLKTFCEDNGVEMIDDEYISSHQNEKGIEYITCKDSGNHYADLFIDCTGFKSLLLEKELKTPYKSYSDTLINNRALICKVPYVDKENQLKNYTNCVTMKNGWCWEIPLWDGVSLGYVHSTKFESEEEIQNEFESFISEKYKVTPDEIRELDFITGRHEDGWVKNVVAIGLSYGFIEPLEATGIYLLLYNIFRLVEVLSSQKTINSFDKKLFNYSVGFETDRQKSFIEMHYIPAHRNDTEYWNYVINEIEYDWDSLNQKLALNMTILDRDYSNSFYGGLPYILGGNGYGPYNPGFIKRSEIDIHKDIQKQEWLKKDIEINERVEKFKTTFEFLKEKLYERKLK